MKGAAWEKLDLNELPQYSPWIGRLLGLEPWNIPVRDRKKVEQEYDKDKYARCLSHFFDNTVLSPEDVFWSYVGSPPDSQVCISQGNSLYITTLAGAFEKYRSIIIGAMAETIRQGRTIIELGCGFGYWLRLLSQRFSDKVMLGGEYSWKAVTLASHLFGGTIRVLSFDFYDPANYTFIEDAPEPVVIFTVHAIEQLPLSGIVFDTLRKYKERIHSVFHFEPVYKGHDNFLLGLMRRRYGEINDYNRDLLSQLKENDIQILRFEPDVFGINPLNPTSIIHWKYR